MASALSLFILVRSARARCMTSQGDLRAQKGYAEIISANVLITLLLSRSLGRETSTPETSREEETAEIQADEERK